MQSSGLFPDPPPKDFGINAHTARIPFIPIPFGLTHMPRQCLVREKPGLVSIKNDVQLNQ
jgi:hypothetical protein